MRVFFKVGLHMRFVPQYSWDEVLSAWTWVYSAQCRVLSGKLLEHHSAILYLPITPESWRSSNRWRNRFRTSDWSDVQRLQKWLHFRECKASQERLNRIVLLIAIAYTCAGLAGQKNHNKSLNVNVKIGRQVVVSPQINIFQSVLEYIEAVAWKNFLGWNY